MIDYALVTVRYADKMEKDMELPAQLEIQKLTPMLLEALQTAEPNLFSDKNNIFIKANGKRIDNGTLFENKVWDGAVLEIVC